MGNSRSSGYRYRKLKAKESARDAEIYESLRAEGGLRTGGKYATALTAQDKKYVESYLFKHDGSNLHVEKENGKNVIYDGTTRYKTIKEAYETFRNPADGGGISISNKAYTDIRTLKKDLARAKTAEYKNRAERAIAIQKAEAAIKEHNKLKYYKEQYNKYAKANEKTFMKFVKKNRLKFKP